MDPMILLSFDLSEGASGEAVLECCATTAKNTETESRCKTVEVAMAVSDGDRPRTKASFGEGGAL
jgi:hypothetical protein